MSPEPQAARTDAALTALCCRRCGYVAHPPRILCPACGARDWAPEPITAGTIAEVTLRRSTAPIEGAASSQAHWIRLAAVHSDRGPRVIARCIEELKPGERVRLHVEQGVVIATRARSTGRAAPAPAS